MIDSTEASRIVEENLPGCNVLKRVEYKTSFIFLVLPPDPDEFPVLFSVDKNTSEFRDFSPFDDVDDLEEFQSLFTSDV